MTTSTAPPRPAGGPAEPSPDPRTEPITGLSSDPGTGPVPITELARRLHAGAVVDADDVIAEIEALGISDRTARERYGMPSVFALGDAVLAYLRHGRPTPPPDRITWLEGRTAEFECRTAPLEGRTAELECRTAPLEGRATDHEGRVTPLQGRTTQLESRATVYEGRAARAGSRATVLEGTLLGGSSGRRRSPRAYLVTPLLRCGLYVGPLVVAATATPALHRVAWPVPALALLLGWGAAQALSSAGGALARRAGVAAAARAVAGGFAASAGLWCAFVWVAPSALLGPDRLLAALVGLGGLLCLATVAGALVTGAEVAVIRWSLPVWLLCAVEVAGAWPPGVPGRVLLAGAVVAAAVRAFRPVLTRLGPPRAALTRAEARQAVAYLVIGVAQAGCVALVWRAGPLGVTPPVLLPLLAAVPMLEALVSWQGDRLDAGLDDADDGAGYARHVRGVALVIVAGLLPPAAVGVALAVAAYRLPYGLSAQGGARDLVLSLAAGTLLGGVFAATLLLAGVGRTGRAAVLAAVPALLLVAAASLRPGAGLLPTIVAALAATHLVGLPAVARTLLEHRRTS